METKRKAGVLIMLFSAFVMLSSYFFTTPDGEARSLQAAYYVSLSANTVLHKPRLSELVVASQNWTMSPEALLTKMRVGIHKFDYYYANPDFFGFIIRYSYLVTGCLFLFFAGLYMVLLSRGARNE